MPVGMNPEALFALESAGWPAILVDSANAICRANQMAVRLFGSVLKGAAPPLSAIWAADNLHTPDQFLARWERSSSPLVTLRFLVKGGDTVPYAVSACQFPFQSQKCVLLQMFSPGSSGELHPTPSADTAVLAQKQKLDCALKLTRTVALDFNNALTGILGHASFLLSQLPPDSPWRPSLMEVERSAARAAEIASALGTFSLEAAPNRPCSDNLNLVVQRTVDSFRQNGGAKAGAIAWNIRLEQGLFATRFDETKMRQALLKVLENAVESLPGGGQITVQTRNVEVAKPFQDHNARLEAGAYVCAEITDNGCGISPAVLPRVFEPFFTTKEGGHRGFGLAWAYGVVTTQGGGIALSSQPGSGTSARLYLPAEKRVVQDKSMRAEDLGGRQTILVVDDEELLLMMDRTILSAYGYQVLTAHNGQEALDILNRKAPVIDLLITDLVMPGINGRELVERVRRLAPATRILCASGSIGATSAASGQNFLQKPFTTLELLVKVKQALAADG
jgi:two-component system, cell cycle sensor histidine kinase and response regulator CckA